MILTSEMSGTKERRFRLDISTDFYGDIDKVMENQQDLVTVVEELRQLMCIKG